MNDLSLTREEATTIALPKFVQLLKELFDATPLGLMIRAFAQS